MSNLNIGPHLSISKGFLKTAQFAKTINANTFQYFSRNPRGGSKRPLDLEDINAYLEYASNNGFATLLCHAPYTLNPASKDESTRDFARIVFKEDLESIKHFPNALYNFHPGSHVGQGVEKGIELTVEILNEVLTPDMSTTVLIETMSGKGSEIGSTFEEIKSIMDKVNNPHLGVCLDTCHVYSAGYDIKNDLDGVLKHFDEVIGLGKLKAIHLNDSMTEFNSHKDRHENIGKGSIGLDAIINLINHPLLKDIPFFLETPCDDETLYKNEIDLLKENYK